MITIQNDVLSVAISCLGAEIHSLRDADGKERIWQGAEGFWCGHAPILFPIAGGLKEDTYYLGGKRYSLPKHGFLRNREFAVEKREADAVTFMYAGDPASEPGYPLPHVFRAQYQLIRNQLQIDYIVHNSGESPLWFGLGGHEAYACPEGFAAYELVFDQRETLRHAVLSGGLLTHEEQIVEEDCEVLTLSDERFANDSLVFLGLKSQGVTLRSPLHGREIRVDFEGFNCLLIWTQPGSRFLCIEPWTNPPDYEDTDQDFTRKPGIIRLEPGESRTLTHTLTIS